MSGVSPRALSLQHGIQELGFGPLQRSPGMKPNTTHHWQPLRKEGEREHQISGAGLSG